jgi:hypothetical protein
MGTATASCRRSRRTRFVSTPCTLPGVFRPPTTFERWSCSSPRHNGFRGSSRDATREPRAWPHNCVTAFRRPDVARTLPRPHRGAASQVPTRPNMEPRARRGSRIHGRAGAGSFTSIARHVGARPCGLRRGEGHLSSKGVHAKCTAAETRPQRSGATPAPHDVQRSTAPRKAECHGIRCFALVRVLRRPDTSSSTRSETKRKRTCRK